MSRNLRDAILNTIVAAAVCAVVYGLIARFTTYTADMAINVSIAGTILFFAGFMAGRQ